MSLGDVSDFMFQRGLGFRDVGVDDGALDVSSAREAEVFLSCRQITDPNPRD